MEGGGRGAARGGGGRAPGPALPGYSSRRRIRARIRRLFPRHLTVFTDAAHTVQVWTWEGRDPGGPLAARELERRPGRPDAEWLRRVKSIVRDAENAAGAASDPGAAPPGSAVLAALLRRVRRLLPAAFAPAGPLAGVLGTPAGERGRARGRALRQRVQDAVEGSGDPALPRALWRALSGLAVLDPACGGGGWLLGAMEALEPVYAACLERMRCWVEEADRSPRPHRGRLADFRFFLERADDLSLFPSPGHFAREAIVLRSLFGAGRDGEALAAAELGLLLRLHPPGEDASAPPPAGIACNLREGDPARGFRSFAELRAALPPADRALELRALQEEAETLARGEDALRDLRLLHGAPAAGLLDGWQGVRRRREALAERLDLLLAEREGISPGDLAAWLAARRPLHAWAEYHGIERRGGFALERGRER